MAHTIEEHHHVGEGSNAFSIIFIAVALFALIVFLFFVFGRAFFTTSNQTAPSVNIPDKIDVNVNGGQQ